MGAARTAIVSGKMHYEVNGVSADWDDRPLRSARPCVVCHEPTQGRMKYDGQVRPAHMFCVMKFIGEKAAEVIDGN